VSAASSPRGSEQQAGTRDATARRGALRQSVRGRMLGCSSAGVGLGATGASIAGELLDEAVARTSPLGRHHPLRSPKMHPPPPAGGPNERELPDPSCAGAAAAALLNENVATLAFLPVRPMPPLSRGIKEQLQADRQHVRGSRSGPQCPINLAHGHGN
jgi:hypothetical protein